MASCPKCKNVVEDTFGLTTCSKCGENFFAGDTLSDDQFIPEEKEDIQINDQNIEHNETEPDPIIPEDNDIFEDQPEFTSSEFEDGDIDNEVDSSVNNLVDEPDDNESDGSQVFSSMPDQPSEAFTPHDDDKDQNQENASSNKNPSDIKLENIMEDVQKSESSSSDIHYNIEIEEIDSPDILKQVLEALDDPRLSWNVSELNVNMGKLVLKNVGSVKAHIVVCYMIGLPVKLNWYQV